MGKTVNTKKGYSEQELDRQFVEATRRGKLAAASAVRAQGVTYDPDLERIIIDVDGDRSFSFSKKLVEGLGDASPEHSAHVKITPDGTGLRWNQLDIDLGISELLAGVYGTRKWMASLGHKGGSVKSAAKTVAARENGKKGGRPRADISLSAKGSFEAQFTVKPTTAVDIDVLAECVPISPDTLERLYQELLDAITAWSASASPESVSARNVSLFGPSTPRIRHLAKGLNKQNSRENANDTFALAA
jgi:hypothetical protein